MRRLYGFPNRNLLLPIQTKHTNIEHSRILPDEKKTITDESTIKNIDTDNVYLNETGRCPYFRLPWWLWLLLTLGLLGLLGLALGLGLGLGLRTPSVNSRCTSNNCPVNSQCINNRCECNSGYYYDFPTAICTALRHVGMTCLTSNTNQQCITNANCASNGYCVCNNNYFLDHNTGECRAVLARYVPCANDDQCQRPFVCQVSLCDCNQTQYYDSGTNTCIRLGYVNEPCSTNSQCIRSANCSTTTCQCATDHYFDTTEYHCIRKRFIGETCTQSYQCIDNANCTSVSPFSNQCECNTDLYYDTTTGICTTKLTHNTTCTSTSQCINNLLCIDDPAVAGVNFKCLCLTTQYYLSSNQTCISLGTHGDSCNIGGRLCETRFGLTCSISTSTCECNLINYWNGTYCVGLFYPGESCTLSSQCINSSSCISSICQCNINHYYSILTGRCEPQLTYLSTCTLGNYQCLNNTLCFDLITSTNGTCSCDSTINYYDGTRCTAYATHSETCAAATFGPFCDSMIRSLVCIGTTCTCISGMYYNGSNCVPYTSAGFPCTTSTECEMNSICSSGICTCLNSYYFDTTTGNCVSRLTYGQTCTSSIQCSTNMICISSQCLCTSTTYHVNFTCVPRISHGGACNLTILCDTTLGLECISSVCSCNSTQYWSTLSNGTQICANLRTLGQSCTSNTDCINSRTSVRCVTNICECNSNGYYLEQSTVTCQSLKTLGVACTATYNFECASFNCNASNVCGESIALTITSNVSQAQSQASCKQSYTIISVLLNVIQVFLHFFFWIL